VLGQIARKWQIVMDLNALQSFYDGYSINGKWKQKCYILPDRGVIVSYLSHIEDDSHDLLESMERNILGIT